MSVWLSALQSFTCLHYNTPGDVSLMFTWGGVLIPVKGDQLELRNAQLETIGNSLGPFDILICSGYVFRSKFHFVFFDWNSQGLVLVVGEIIATVHASWTASHYDVCHNNCFRQIGGCSHSLPYTEHQNVT